MASVSTLPFLKSRLYTKSRLFIVKFHFGHRISYLNLRLYCNDDDDDDDDDDRYAHSGDAPARHSAHVGQRPPAVFLRLLHLRHHRRSTLGRIAQAKVLHPRGGRQLCHPQSLLQVSVKLLFHSIRCCSHASFLPSFLTFFLASASVFRGWRFEPCINVTLASAAGKNE